jgi:hypothetical protein
MFGLVHLNKNTTNQLYDMLINFYVNSFLLIVQCQKYAHQHCHDFVTVTLNIPGNVWKEMLYESLP